jgi:hypothetical protein
MKKTIKTKNIEFCISVECWIKRAYFDIALLPVLRLFNYGNMIYIIEVRLLCLSVFFSLVRTRKIIRL